MGDKTLRDRRAILLLAAIGVKIAILFAFAWHIRFVMDEFWQFGQSKYLFGEFFDTIWPAKAAGYVTFYKFAHVLGWNATSTLLIGRVQTAILACATIVLVYHCSRALGRNQLTALLSVLVLLSFSSFLERIFCTISEPLALFFAIAALLTILRGDPERRSRLLLAGALSGLSFLATQKAVYFNVALGFGLIADALARSQYRAILPRGAWLVVGWLAPLIIYCLVFGGTEAPAIAANLVFGPVAVAVHGGDAYSDLGRFVVQTLTRNAILYLACFAGMALAFSRFRALASGERIALIHALVMTVLVFTHNQPWPYIFLMALPFIALWATYWLDEVPGSFREMSKYWVLLGLGILLSFGMNILYFRFDNDRQMDLIARAERVLSPRETYFDGTGMLPNRKESPYVWLDRGTILATLDQGQQSRTYQGLSAKPPNAILWNYRLSAVEPLIGTFVRHSYVNIGANLLVPGRRLRPGQSSRFTVVQPGLYGLYSAVGRPVQEKVAVNGKLMNAPVRLPTGTVRVELGGRGAPAFLLPLRRYEGLISAHPNEPLFEGVYD